jgi:hypothetical protein
MGIDHCSHIPFADIPALQGRRGCARSRRGESEGQRCALDRNSSLVSFFLNWGRRQARPLLLNGRGGSRRFAFNRVEKPGLEYLPFANHSLRSFTLSVSLQNQDLELVFEICILSIEEFVAVNCVGSTRRGV